MDILSQKLETVISTELGKTKFKVPTLAKRLEIERKRSMYSGELVVISATGADISETFAFLDVVMIECEGLKKTPAGTWDYDLLTEFDYPKLQDAYKKGNEWLDSFRKGMGEEQTKMG